MASTSSTSQNQRQTAAHVRDGGEKERNLRNVAGSAAENSLRESLCGSLGLDGRYYLGFVDDRNETWSVMIGL